MFKDLVSGQSCGVANPLAQLGQSQGQLGLNVQEAKQYSQLGGQQQGGPFVTVAQPQTNPQAVRQDAHEQQFMQQFNNNSMGGQMQLMQPMLMPQGPNVDLMAAEFSSMQNPGLMKQQSMDLQQQPAMLLRPSSDMSQAWSDPQQQQQQQHMQHQQMLHRQNSQTNAQQQHMQMYNMMMMQQQQQQPQMMQQMQQNALLSSSSQGPSLVSSAPSAFREAIQQQSSNNAVKDGDAEIQDPLNAFVAEEPAFQGQQQQYTSALNPEMMERMKTSDNAKWKNSKFMQFVGQVNSGEIVVDGDSNSMKVVPEDKRVQLNKGGEWAEEFQADPALTDLLGDGQNQQGDLWGESFADVERMFQGMNVEQDQQHELESQRVREDYKFMTTEESNKYMKTSNAYEKGVQLLKQGKLREAIMALEAAVMEQDTNADAWARLGQARAENEEEPAAIAALTKAIDLDPYHLQALLMLGVSHTNDLEEGKAMNYLRTWLLHHPEYQSGSMTEEQNIMKEYEEMYGASASLDRNTHDQVIRMFLNAVKINPLDPEIHEVLGVLYHISHDYVKAIESFKNALQIDGNNPQLWNKLGATQANSNNSKEALLSYRRALQLRPTYVRALANTAIAFANQGQHADAARTYLATLKQNPSAEHIWSYLRISLSHMGRDDLVQLTTSRDVSLFNGQSL
jgi:peroxin-5